jgi:hypothetical protein
VVPAPAAPAEAGSVPPVYVTVNWPDPPPRAAERRFSLANVRWLFNGTAGLAAVFLLPVANDALHVCGDEYGIVYAGVLAAAVLETVSAGRRQPRWRFRAFTFLMAAVTVATPAGLHAISYPITGV